MCGTNLDKAALTHMKLGSAGDMLAMLKNQGPFQHTTTKPDMWT